MPPDRVVEDVVGHAEGVLHRGRLRGDRQELLVGDHDHAVDAIAQGIQAHARVALADCAFPIERTGHDGDGEDSQIAGNFRHDGSRTRSRSTAHAGGDEHHVGTLETLGNLFVALLHRGATDLGVRTRAKSARRSRSDLDLHLGQVRLEHLQIRVDGNELDTGQARLDHAIDGIAARATDADDLDAGWTDVFRGLDAEVHAGAPCEGIIVCLGIE